MFKSPAVIRKLISLTKARRLLYAAGVPPVKRIVASLSDFFLPDFPADPVTKPSTFNNGDIVEASDITTLAESFQEDTDILQTWSNTLQSELEHQFTERENRRKNIERRLRQIITTARNIRNFSFSGVSKGPGSLYKNIDFSDPTLIDYLRSTVDIIPSAGVQADGEASLSTDPLRTKRLDKSKFKITNLNYPEGSLIISPIENVLTDNNTEPFQIVIPGNGQGSVTVDLLLNFNSMPELISGVDIRGITECTIKVYTTLDNRTWTLQKTGKLSTLNKTLLRFPETRASGVRVELLNPKRTPADNGETLGIRSLNIFRAAYLKEGVLITQKLLEEASPLEGVRLNVKSFIPENSSIDIEVSFTGPEEGFLKTKRLTSEADGVNLTVWNPNSSISVFNFDVAVPSVDSSRFWTLPNGISDAVLWDAELFAGIDQWFVESKEVNYSELDFAYKAPLLEDWPLEQVDKFDGGIFLSPRFTITGDITEANILDPISGSSLEDGFLFRNNHQYFTGDLEDHLLILATDGVQNFLSPGREYRLTTYVHCLKETAIDLAANLPGASAAGGTLPFSLYINGKSALAAGETSLEGLSSWLEFSSTASFTPGWNKIELLVYRPREDNEMSPSGACALRLSLDPLSASSKESLNISRVRCKTESLNKTTEFALKILRAPGDRSAWAWEENSTTPDFILGHHWNHDPTDVFLDGISVGEGAKFEASVRRGSVESSPGLWIRSFLRSNGTITPELKYIEIEVI